MWIDFYKDLGFWNDVENKILNFKWNEIKYETYYTFPWNKTERKTEYFFCLFFFHQT